MFMGEPAEPAPAGFLGSIRSVVSADGRVMEAYYPQCYIPTVMERPAQVLFVLSMSKSEAELAVHSLMKKFDELIEFDVDIYLVPLSISDAIVSELRRVGCKVHG